MSKLMRQLRGEIYSMKNKGCNNQFNIYILFSEHTRDTSEGPFLSIQIDSNDL